MSISNKQKPGGTLLRSAFLTITLVLAGFMLSYPLPLAYPLLNIESTKYIWPLRQPERLGS
jgi:hypothetical protein